MKFSDMGYGRPHEPYRHEVKTQRFRIQSAKWRGVLMWIFGALALAALLAVGPPVCGG